MYSANKDSTNNTVVSTRYHTVEVCKNLPKVEKKYPFSSLKSWLLQKCLDSNEHERFEIVKAICDQIQILWIMIERSNKDETEEKKKQEPKVIFSIIDWLLLPHSMIFSKWLFFQYIFHPTYDAHTDWIYIPQRNLSVIGVMIQTVK